MKKTTPATGVKTTLELITPEKAKQYLAKNKRNRPISANAVTAYARDIKNNNWLPNHQGIAFNNKGQLIDGQHRLLAVIEANIPILINVTIGLSDEHRNGVIVNVMDTVDRGRVRTIGQQLILFHGISNGFRVAAVCVAIAKIFTSESRRRLTTAQTLHILKIYKKDIEAIYSFPDAQKRLTASLSAPIVLLHNSEPKPAMDFAEKLITLEGLSAGSPVAALIKWRDKHRDNNIEWDLLRACACCLKSFRARKPIGRVMAATDSLHWLIGLQQDNVRKVVELFHLT